MNSKTRERFDGLLEEVLAELWPQIGKLLEEVPLIAEDEPGPEVLQRMGLAGRGSLCGLYTGIPLVQRSVRHSGVLPDKINIYRRGIIEAARSRVGKLSDGALKRQIRLTVLHEVGHHFGLGESDLADLGYH